MLILGLMQCYFLVPRADEGQDRSAGENKQHVLQGAPGMQKSRGCAFPGILSCQNQEQVRLEFPVHRIGI